MTDTSNWRSVIKVHPAAELFPLMSPDELKTLGDDIKANKLQNNIVFWYPGVWQSLPDLKDCVLLDGRNRMDAMEAVGIDAVHEASQRKNCICGDHFPDPYSFVVSANIHRRHLTTAQKSELIEALLKATPEKSDRDIAATTKVDHKTVGAKRAKLEAGGEIPQVAKRAGRDGKSYKQPSKAEISAFVAGAGPQKIVTSKTNHTTGKALTAQIVKLPTAVTEKKALAGELMDLHVELAAARELAARFLRVATALADANRIEAAEELVAAVAKVKATWQEIENDNESASQLASDDQASQVTDKEAMKKLSRMRIERIPRSKREAVGISEVQTNRLVAAGMLTRWPDDPTVIERPPQPNHS